MKKFNLNTAFGILVAFVGMIWVLFILLMSCLGFIEKATDLVGFLVSLFYIICLLVFALPGILAIYFGFRLIRQKSKKNIKRAVGALAVFGAFLFFPILNPYWEYLKEIPDLLLLLVGSFIMIPVYVAISKFLMKKEGLIPEQGEFIGKGIVGLVSWVLCLACFQLFTQNKIPDDNLDKPWQAILSLSPIIIAFVFYRICIRIIEKRNVKSSTDIHVCDKV